MNGVSAKNFAVDMGFSLKKAVRLNDAALSRLASYGGLTGSQLEELVSWTGKDAEGVSKTFRDEVFVSRAVRNPIIRGCPICLREDAEIAPSQPLSQMTMRGDWQLREVDVCIKHSHQLVPLWKSSAQIDRYDLSSHFKSILDDILECKLERPRVDPSPYDYWLDTRLRTKADDTWLAEHALYPAATFCTLLGTELLRLEDTKHLDQEARTRRARALGFHVSSQGEAKILDALRTLADRAVGAKAGPQNAFGHLFIDFSQAYVDKPDFDPFRRVLREGIVRNWPVAAGQKILGIVQPNRQIHSVISAVEETGIGQALLEKHLLNAGAISADDNRPAARKTFDAIEYGGLLAEIPTLVGPIAMQRAMGATKGELEALVKDGVLVPRISIAGVKSPWRISDGTALVDELKEIAIATEASFENWERIQEAKNRTNLGVGAIIAQVRAKKLQLARRNGLQGYTAFCVLKEEIDLMKDEKVEVTGGPLITAAAFGRLVGIRTQGWFERLSAAGHTPATRGPHPKYGGEWIYASTRDIEEFRERFLTSKMMKDEFGLRSGILLSNLKRFAPDGEDYGPLYLREEARRVLGQLA